MLCALDKCRYYVYNESMIRNNTTKGNAMRNAIWIIKEASVMAAFTAIRLAIVAAFATMIMLTSIIGALILLSDMM